MYIGQDMTKVTGGVSAKTVYRVSYSFPHNLTDNQRKLMESNMDALATTISRCHPVGAEFRDVRVRFTEFVVNQTMKTEKALTVHLESTKEPTIEDKRQIANVMESYMQDCLSVTQSSGYQVYYQDEPFTVPIADKCRADLAYSMLVSMAENGVQAKIQGDRIPLDVAEFSIRDADGNFVQAHPDLEWFGTVEDNHKYKEDALTKQIQNGIENGILDPKRYSREFEEALQEPYSICFYGRDHIPVSFAPDTWDVSKAGEMQNFMMYGRNPDIPLYAKSDEKFVKIRGPICIVNSDYDVLCDQLNRAWPCEESGKADFASAVENLSNDNGMTI